MLLTTALSSFKGDGGPRLYTTEIATAAQQIAAQHGTAQAGAGIVAATGGNTAVSGGTVTGGALRHSQCLLVLRVAGVHLHRRLVIALGLVQPAPLEADGSLQEVPEDLWHIQTEEGAIPDTLSEDVLYEIHVLVQDGGTFDLSENEKEIKVSVVAAQ